MYSTSYGRQSSDTGHEAPYSGPKRMEISGSTPGRTLADRYRQKDESIELTNAIQERKSYEDRQYQRSSSRGSSEPDLRRGHASPSHGNQVPQCDPRWREWENGRVYEYRFVRPESGPKLDDAVIAAKRVMYPEKQSGTESQIPQIGNGYNVSHLPASAQPPIPSQQQGAFHRNIYAPSTGQAAYDCTTSNTPIYGVGRTINNQPSNIAPSANASAWKVSDYLPNLPFSSSKDDNPHKDCDATISKYKERYKRLKEDYSLYNAAVGKELSAKANEISELKIKQLKDQEVLRKEIRAIKAKLREKEAEVARIQQIQYDANRSDDVLLDETVTREIQKALVTDLDRWAAQHLRMDKKIWSSLVKAGFVFEMNDKEKSILSELGFNPPDFSTFLAHVDTLSFNMTEFLSHGSAFGHKVTQAVIHDYLLKNVIGKPFHGIDESKETNVVNIYNEMATYSPEQANKWRVLTIKTLERQSNTNGKMVLQMGREAFYNNTTINLMQIIEPVMIYKYFMERRQSMENSVYERSREHSNPQFLPNTKDQAASDRNLRHDYEGACHQLHEIVRAVGKSSVDWGKKLFNVVIVDKHYIAHKLDAHKPLVCPRFDNDHRFMEERGGIGEEGEVCHIVGVVASGLIKEGSERGERFDSQIIWEPAMVLLAEDITSVEALKDEEEFSSELEGWQEPDGHNEASGADPYFNTKGQMREEALTDYTDVEMEDEASNRHPAFI